jgi:hypothetical protein
MAVLGTERGQPLGILALFNPWTAQGGQPASEINLGIRVSIWTGAIVDGQGGFCSTHFE